jgi:hypothetical protein
MVRARSSPWGPNPLQGVGVGLLFTAVVTSDVGPTTGFRKKMNFLIFFFLETGL